MLHNVFTSRYFIFVVVVFCHNEIFNYFFHVLETAIDLLYFLEVYKEQ